LFGQGAIIQLGAPFAVKCSMKVGIMTKRANKRAQRYKKGDYVKVEFPDETTGIAEWMWVKVEVCDDERQLLFGQLDNEPLNDYRGKIELGSQLAVKFSQIREHRKPTEFTKQ
jgi:hypothetical protein